MPELQVRGKATFRYQENFPLGLSKGALSSRGALSAGEVHAMKADSEQHSDHQAEGSGGNNGDDFRQPDKKPRIAVLISLRFSNIYRFQNCCNKLVCSVRLENVQMFVLKRAQALTCQEEQALEEGHPRAWALQNCLADCPTLPLSSASERGKRPASRPGRHPPGGLPGTSWQASKDLAACNTECGLCHTETDMYIVRVYRP